MWTFPACSALLGSVLQEFLSKWGRPEGAQTDDEEASQASGHAPQPYISTPSVLPELKEREGGAFQDSAPPQSYGGESPATEDLPICLHLLDPCSVCCCRSRGTRAAAFTNLSLWIVWEGYKPSVQVEACALTSQNRAAHLNLHMRCAYRPYIVSCGSTIPLRSHKMS